jgi:DNA modification methylase
MSTIGDKDFFIANDDCIKHMATMPENCIHFSAYSPPFPSVFSYTSLQEDLGNSEDRAEMKLHFSFFFKQIFRIMKPGRVMAVHCQNIVRMRRTGGEGLFDFLGFLIRLGERAGFVHDYAWSVRRNPQAQAIRTRSRPLQFAGLESDRALSRGALPDYIIKFRKPGENAVPIDSKDQVSRNEWIDWAEHCWDDINETDTLNTKEAKGPLDVRHICALQLDICKRLVKLFSNPDEIVFSPFAGIGSELRSALLLGRRAYGCELKPEYHATAIRNCEKAIAIRAEEQAGLFDQVTA